MTIRTNLENEGGSLVIVDGAEVSYTPLPTSFIYKPGRKVRLIKDGYEAESFVQPTPTPAPDLQRLDSPVENPLPSKLQDEDAIRCYFQPPGDVDELLQRAHELRNEARVVGEQRAAHSGPVVPSSLDF